MTRLSTISAHTLLGLEDIGPRLIAGSRQIKFDAAEGALDL
jgi:hypothetical protein